MNTEDFILYISSPEKLNSESAAHLSAVLKEFPYCQTAQLLYAKNLHNIKDIHYGNQLKTAAIYAADRKTLYHLVMQRGLVQKIEEIEEKATSKKQESGSEKKEVGIQKPAEKERQPERVSLLEQEIIKEAISASYSLEGSLKNIAEEKTIEKEAKNKKEKIVVKEKMTFSEWMAVLKQPAQEELNPKPETPNPIDEMLEKLSKAATKITAKKEFFSPANVGRLSLIDDDKFVTETLAKIYEQQGNYAKAISAYKNLSLKYPEKSSYFASRILTLEKLINQRKTN